MYEQASMPVEEEKETPPSVTDRRALVQRVAASKQFSRAARLRAFLLYVGQESLRAEAAEIHEQDIGIRVFGRSHSYDRSQDNIVRVNATELRKRVDAYFLNEGSSEPLIFSIPRGGYRTVFRWRAALTLSESADKVECLPLIETVSLQPLLCEPASSRVQTVSKSVFLLLLVSAGLLLVACGWLLYANRQLRRSTNLWDREPVVAKFWTEATRDSAQTDIVLPDASLSVSEEILGRPLTLSEYLDHRYVPEREKISADRRGALQNLFNHNLVTLGDAHAAQQLLELSPLASTLHLTLARFYEADLLQQDNVVLIGGEKANPWLHLFAGQMNFHLEYSADGDRMYIENRHLQPGEQSRYEAAMDRYALSGYCIVAYLPNMNFKGSVIVLAGSDSDATGSAAEFLTSNQQLKYFLKRLHTSDFPYFEVLLKTSRMSGASFNSQIIAYRTYPKGHPS